MAAPCRRIEQNLVGRRQPRFRPRRFTIVVCDDGASEPLVMSDKALHWSANWKLTRLLARSPKLLPLMRRHVLTELR